jgi:hypothetical protein
MTKKNIIVAVVVVVVVIAGYFGYNAYQARQASPEVQQAKLQEEKNEILQKVAALTQVPEEEPVLFTVNDANLLKSQQAFFKDAENGDVLLVYQSSSKALIYRPSSNKIINAGPVSFQQPQSGAKETTKK